MSKICGKLDDMSSWRAEKARAIFDQIVIDRVQYKGMWVANQTLADEILIGAQVGQRVCLYYFGHMLRKKIIIGLKPENGPLIAMERKGLFGGLLWYFVYSPIIMGLGYGFVGGMVGALGGQQASALGGLGGLVLGVGGSWYTYYRMVTSYRAMQREAAASALPVSA
jgi:hypothetical protein